jgi:hypothetical protein
VLIAQKRLKIDYLLIFLDPLVMEEQLRKFKKACDDLEEVVDTCNKQAFLKQINKEDCVSITSEILVCKLCKSRNMLNTCYVYNPSKPAADLKVYMCTDCMMKIVHEDLEKLELSDNPPTPRKTVIAVERAETKRFIYN